MSNRLEGMGQAKKYGGLTVLHNKRRTFNGKISFDHEALVAPLSWRKPRMIFVNSMSDLFHPDVPFEFVDRVFAVMALCPQHTFQVLTKRPERMAEYITARSDSMLVYRKAMSILIQSCRKGVPGESTRFPLPNVWLGTSCEDQSRYDERIEHLKACPAAVRFLSCEPLLGPINLRLGEPKWVHPNRDDDGRRACERIGVGIGDDLLKASVAGWVQPEGRLGEVRWENGRLVVHEARRMRVTGWYTPEYGESDRGGVLCDHGMTNIVLGKLRTGHVIGDPELVFPIAKAPPRTVDWAIVGGESGANSRNCDIEWIKSLVAQCKAAGVAPYVKQLGKRPVNGKMVEILGPSKAVHYRRPVGHPDVAEALKTPGYSTRPMVIKLADSKGANMDQWANDDQLRQLGVRQFPHTQKAPT
jgi:protein gp37